MANLLDSVLNAIKAIQGIESLGPFGPALFMLSLATSPDMVDKIAEMMPAEKRSDPAVQAALASLKKDLGKVKAVNPYDMIAGASEPGKNPITDVARDLLIQAVQDLLGSGAVDLEKSLGDLARAPIEAVLSVVEGGGAPIEAALRDKIVKSVTPMISLGLSWVILSTLAELIHPVKNMGFGGISHFLYETVGFQALSNSYIAPVREGLIEDPIRHQVLAVSRPFNPSIGSISWLARKRLIDKAQFDEGYAFWGVKQEWADREYQGLWSQPRLLELVRIQEGADLPPDYLTRKLRLAGFSDEDLPLLLGSLRKRFVTQVIGNLHTLKRNQYKNGAITRTQYIAYLEAQGLGPEEYREFVDSVDAERAFDEAQDLAQDQAAATRSEVAAQRALARTRYKNGAIDKATYISTLTTAGIPQAQAQVLADTVDEEVRYEDGRDLQAAQEARFLAGQITLEELRSDLVAIGRTPDRIEARLRTLTEKKALKVSAGGEVKTLTQAQVLAAYKEGRLQRAEGLKRLTDQGLDATDAGLLLDDQDQAVLAEVQAERIRAAEQRALLGRSSRAELVQAYLDNGKTQDWAEARADYIAERVLGKETVA
jgi:hypothetical protein